jgi:hypothetical protein
MFERNTGSVLVEHRAGPAEPLHLVKPKHVFVGGLHRSGTTLVTRLLSSSAGATGLIGTGFMEDEGHYLHDVVPSAFSSPGSSQPRFRTLPS